MSDKQFLQGHEVVVALKQSLDGLSAMAADFGLQDEATSALTEMLGPRNFKSPTEWVSAAMYRAPFVSAMSRVLQLTPDMSREKFTEFVTRIVDGLDIHLWSNLHQEERPEPNNEEMQSARSTIQMILAGPLAIDSMWAGRSGEQSATPSGIGL